MTQGHPSIKAVQGLCKPLFQEFAADLLLPCHPHPLDLTSKQEVT
jgi:hypothetical protein